MLQGISGFGCQLRQSRVRLPSHGWPDYPKKPRLCRKSAQASHFTDLSILTLHEQYRCTAPLHGTLGQKGVQFRCSWTKTALLMRAHPKPKAWYDAESSKERTILDLLLRNVRAESFYSSRYDSTLFPFDVWPAQKSNPLFMPSSHMTL